MAYKDEISVEYTIIMVSGDDLIYDSKSESNEMFEEIESSSEWIQYYRKFCVEDEDGNAEEEDVTIYCDNI